MTKLSLGLKNLANQDVLIYYFFELALKIINQMKTNTLLLFNDTYCV